MEVVSGVFRDLSGATAVTNGTDCTHECDSDCRFQELIAAFVYLLAIWMFGRAAMCLRMPSLVGEILCGILLGPNLLEFVPEHAAFILVGEVGLALLVVEAGLDVDLDMLRVIGVRGVIVAVLGSMVPLAIGFGLAKGYLGLDDTGAFIVGASLAPTSMGIALNVLKKHRAQNTPTGQLVIAAAVLDDIIALILLSEVDALRNGSGAWAYVQPVVVAVGLIIAFGIVAVFVFPRVITTLLQMLDEEHHGNVILGLLFVFAIALSYVVRLAGSSHLLGCFIAGLCFCTQPVAHHVWQEQVKRILSWLLRVFFSATIGFEVPVKNFASGEIVANGFLFLVPVIGKLITGIWAKPLSLKNSLTIAFAMSAWGEFAFILIVEAKNDHIVSEETFSSLVLAILLSVILAPIGLRTTLVYFNRLSEIEVANAMKHMQDPHSKDETKIPLYYWIHSSSSVHWGQQDAILRAIYSCDVHIMDLRTFRFDHDEFEVQVVYDIYVRDSGFSLDKTHYRNPTMEENKRIEEKCLQLHHAIFNALKADRPSVRVGRWFAGIKKDTVDPEMSAHKAAKRYFTQRNSHHESIMDSLIESDEDDVRASYLEGFVKHEPLDVMLYADSVRESLKAEPRPRVRRRSQKNTSKPNTTTTTNRKDQSNFAELEVITSNKHGSKTIQLQGRTVEAPGVAELPKNCESKDRKESCDGDARGSEGATRSLSPIHDPNNENKLSNV